MKGKLSTRNGILYCVLYYTDADGVYRQKWISTGLKERGNRRDAEKILEAKLIELGYLESVKPLTKKELRIEQKKQILWLDYLKTYIDRIKSELSALSYNVISKSYMRAFTEFWKDKHLFLSDVTAQHILDFYAFLKKTRSVKNITLKHYASVLRPALKSAFKDKLITENPFDFYLP